MSNNVVEQIKCVVSIRASGSRSWSLSLTQLHLEVLWHCVNSVQIRIYFWSVFSCIGTRNNSAFGHFSRSVTVCNGPATSWTQPFKIQAITFPIIRLNTLPTTIVLKPEFLFNEITRQVTYASSEFVSKILYTNFLARIFGL